MGTRTARFWFLACLVSHFLEQKLFSFLVQEKLFWFFYASTFPFCTELSYLILKPSTIKHITTYQTCFPVLGLADSNLQGFKDELRQYWFMRYSRSRGVQLDSGGFEHVFVGEVRGNSVTGFHNWVQFYESEREGVLDYTAFRNQCQV